MKRTILFVILAVFWSAPMLTAQEKTGEPEKLGKVHFPVSCTSAAQQQFDRAMAMLHSFWVSPAAESPRRCGKFHHIDAHREVERARSAADWSQNTGLEG